MAKAFVFALDSILALFILALTMNGIYLAASGVEQDASEELMLKYQCNDALAVLDKSGSLFSANATLIAGEMNALLPPGISWNLTAEYFNYSGGFVPGGNLSAGSGITHARLLVASDRAFAGNDAGGNWTYGTARLRLWNALE